MKRPRTSWKHRISFMSACIATAFAANAGADTLPPDVIDQGQGWQLVMVQPDAADGLGTLSNEPAPIVMIESAEGLTDAPLPEAIKLELAGEFGDSSEPVSLAVHYDVAEAIAAGNAAELYAGFLEPDGEGEAGAAAIGCSTGWRHRTRSFERSFDGFQQQWNPGSGGFTGNIRIDAPITGQGSMVAEYAFKKTAFCLPWTVKFVRAHAQATLDVGETLLEAQGTAKFQTSDRKVLLKPSIDTAFMIGPIPVIVGAEFPIGAGYDVSASAEANLALKSRAQGQLAVDVVCDARGCERNETGVNANTISFDDLVHPGNLSGGVALQADVKPYAFLEARGFLYGSSLGSAGVGVEVSAPSRLFHYAGTGCGNGTGASGNELVNGGYVNVGAQIEFYWNATLFGNDRFNWFDTPISSLAGFFREVEVDRFLRGGRKHTALRGELFFADYKASGTKSPLSPIITGPASVGMGASAPFQVSKRPCLPMDEALNYSVAWGDGTPTSTLSEVAPTAVTPVSHVFNSFGSKTITAKLVNDVAGRSINEATQRSINVDANAKPPVPASINVPASDADGSFAVSWSSSVNSSNYKLFRSNNGGAYVLLSSPTGTSMNLSSQPFGTNRYAVQACNNIGCSSSRHSGNVQVGVVPAAPTLTVSSHLCFGGNDVRWTTPSGASSYRLYASTGTNPNNAGEIYSGSGAGHVMNVTSTTHLWVKACGTGGCSGFSGMKTAQVYPVCN